MTHVYSCTLCHTLFIKVSVNNNKSFTLNKQTFMHLIYCLLCQFSVLLSCVECEMKRGILDCCKHDCYRLNHNNSINSATCVCLVVLQNPNNSFTALTYLTLVHLLDIFNIACVYANCIHFGSGVYFNIPPSFPLINLFYTRYKKVNHSASFGQKCLH